MWPRFFHFALISSLGAASLSAQLPPPGGPREALAALDRLQVDPAAIYKVDLASHIELRRGDAKLLFEEGFLGFFGKLEGRITGVVFSGRGHILAIPRDPVEKQQLAHFLGAPMIDQDFSSAYLRFTDDTASELAQQLQVAHNEPQPDAAFIEGWQAPVLSRNSSHSFRILSESYSQAPRPFFAATLGGVAQGSFDFTYDQQREETQLFGQARKANGVAYYDVWSSYCPPGTRPAPVAFDAVSYRIETTVRPDNSVSATATIQVRAASSGERLVRFEFSPLLNIETVTEGAQTLSSFPDSDSTPAARAESGNGTLYVVLPHAAAAGDEIELTFRYHGNVIRDAGNGVLFVGARESWYPHLGGTASFARYDLTFHWPRRLRLAATGSKVDEHEEADTRTGHWKTDKPASVAGFNLGEYAFASLPNNAYSVDVYANRQLEQALLNRIREPQVDDLSTAMAGPGRFGGQRADPMRLQMPPASPADALKSLAREIDSSIRFYEKLSGPVPFHQLSVSQIPGTFGQGWPGLLYLSTYSFLPADTQQRAGLSETGQEHFHDLVPFHEVAHQWWGNVVGWSDYRDQWIDEGLANYLALLFADSQKTPQHKLRLWLDRYRKRLAEKDPHENVPAEIGSLNLGFRLDSSRSPEGFETLVYGKASWVFHMIREMLREPLAKNPDARFIALLHTLQSRYAYRALSTDDLQHEIELVMTPAMGIESRHSMDWFFADWVRGTGIPHYRIEYSTRRSEKGFLIKGKLLQKGVADSFVVPVPVYASNAGYLGRIVASGPETQFHFTSPREPGKLVVDPQMTLLCITER